MRETLIATPDPDDRPYVSPEIGTIERALEISRAKQVIGGYLDRLFDGSCGVLDTEAIRDDLLALFPHEVSLLIEEGVWT
jgi:hypothetical protein